MQVLADIDEEALARVAEECTDIRESLGVRAPARLLLQGVHEG